VVWKFDTEKAQWFKAGRAGRLDISSEPAFNGHDLFAISELYHENTKTNTVEDLGPEIFSKAFKSYPGRHRVELPRHSPRLDMPLETAVLQRRSPQAFSGASIGLDELAKLLFFMSGITGQRPYGEQGFIRFRTTPSAGALYPLELYPVVLRVDDIEAGLYHYNVKDHALERLQLGDFSQLLCAACMQNERLLPASVVFIISAIFQRTKQKYGERAYRHVLMEGGHMGQNCYLTATALRLACTTVGGFIDDSLNHFLGVDGVDEAVLYLAAVGPPSEA